MEKVCNSCKLKDRCKKYQEFSEEERDDISCGKYSPMPLDEYIIWRKEHFSSYMINTEGAKKYLKE
jgi:hypothetical protein